MPNVTHAAALDVALKLLQGAGLLLAAPLLAGLLSWLPARLQLRQGPRIIQPYLELYKLMSRPAARAPTVTLISSVAPYMLVATYGLLAFMLPVIVPSALLPSDFLLVLYLLGLARFTLALAGLDAGAPFGGLGAGREMFLQFLTEIGLGLWIVGLVVRWGTTDMAYVLQKHWNLGLGSFFGEPELWVLGLALFFLTLLETERLPVDNPATHLELTMSQQAVALEYAGRDLAAMRWAESIKLVALMTLAAQMFVPILFDPYLPPLAGEPAAWVMAGLGFLLRLGLVILVLALWEVYQPKRRLRQVPRIALMSMVLSMIAVLYTVAFVPR